jgi:hypothetical protein
MTLRVLDQRGSEVKPHRVISVFQTALKENFKTISPASLSLKPALELAQRRLFKGLLTRNLCAASPSERFFPG